MPFSRWAAAAAALLMLPALLAAEKRWTLFRTDNFELYTTAGNRQGKEAIQHFERVRAFFANFARTQRSNNELVRIIAFDSEKEYRPYAPNAGAFAYYVGGVDRDYIVMQQLGRESFPVAVHEYTHLMVKHSEAKVPAWLNEGLAELYSSLRAEGEKVIVGDLLAGRFLTLKNEKWLALDQLLEVDHSSPYYNEKNKMGIFYAESWALTHMLQLDQAYRPGFSKFLAALEQPGGAAAAFQTAYGKDIPVVAKDLRKYMDGNRFFAAVFSIPLAKNVENPEIRPAEAVESGVALAELHALGRRYDLARAEFEQLAAEHPNRLEVHEGLARLEMYARQPEKGIASFRKAMELGSKSPRLHRDYGWVLRGAGDADGAAAAMIKAVALDPSLVDGHLFLASHYLGKSQWGAALSSLSSIKQVKPDRAFQYFSSMARARWELGQKDEAKKDLAKARTYAKETGEQRYADQLGRYFDPPVREVRLVQPARPDPAPAAEHAGEEREAEPRELRRRPAGQAVEEMPRSAEKIEYVEGTLAMLECRATGPRLHVDAGGRKLIFLMNQPDQIVVKKAGGGTHDFNCGPQPKSAVRVGYKPRLDATGDLREIEFR